MDVITFQDIMKLNEQLNKYGFSLSLKDMCSGQLVSIRNLQKEKVIKIPSCVYNIIDDYFKKQFIKISYNEQKTSFVTGSLNCPLDIKVK